MRVIAYLEDAPARTGGGRYWPKFPECVAEHDSGIAQHVQDVFRHLEILEEIRKREADQLASE